MRRITDVSVHYTFTRADESVDPNIGWMFHYLIHRDGYVQSGLPLDLSGAHVTAHNDRSVCICWVGGKDDSDDGESINNMTEDQEESLFETINTLKDSYPEIINVKGHRDYKGEKTQSPGFNVAEWYARKLIAQYTDRKNIEAEIAKEGPITREVIRSIFREEMQILLETLERRAAERTIEISTEN